MKANVYINMKNSIRRNIKDKIKELEYNYKTESNYKIFETLVSLADYCEATTIFCFVGTVDEIDTKPIILHALNSGKRVAVPKCIGKGIMEAYIISSLDELEEGYRGILEPQSDCKRLQPEEIELAIIPCLSASQKGERLGYGGGFYDRYLCRTNATRLLLCRERLMSDTIPTEEHDQIMDIVLTEDRVVRVSCS